MLSCLQLVAGEARRLVAKFGLTLVEVGDRVYIPGSYWGEPEAGLVGQRVFVRGDTPVHSLLHETAHVVCMDPERRARLERDALGDDLEESAVCYLQLCLADHLTGAGRARIMSDMDGWGYSFRLGSTRAFFESDASEARAWLVMHGLLTTGGEVTFRSRGRR